jgi:hypothetical protein
MSGYRQHSFDPEAYQAQGRPLRPFNYVQWTGVALAVLILAATAIHTAGLLGWIRPVIGNPSPMIGLMVVAVVFINSRREPSTLVGSEQLRKNRRWLLITTLICVAALGAAALIDFIGA